MEETYQLSVGEIERRPSGALEQKTTPPANAGGVVLCPRQDSNLRQRD
jgi:hypothetical protein